MFIYTHVSTHLGNVALILLEKKTNSKDFKTHQKSGKKKVKRVKGLTCRKCTVI